MSHSGRRGIAVIVWVLVGVLWLPGAGWCEMIQTPVQTRQGESRQQSIERAKIKSLEDAVFQKALRLLPGQLSKKRRQALRDWIAPRLKNFVRTYEVLDPGQSGGLLVMDVRLDEQALSKMLRLSGAYYTVKKKQTFQLDLQGASAEDKQRLDALMTLSGLEPAVDVMPSLRLHKTQGRWTGSLETGYGQFSEQGRQLVPVWTKLWEHYFATLAPPAKEEAPKNARALSRELIVRGFRSPDRVYVLDAAISKWESLVAKATLLKMDLNPLGIEAVWRVDVFDAKAFADRLRGYIGSSGLTYDWESGP